jgi:exoribonuclease R
MNQLKIQIENRDYSSYKLFNPITNNVIDICEEDDAVKIDPIDMKLFTGDIINYNGEIISSIIRNEIYIPGVLILEGNKTFGRTDNKKRLLYKCIPHNIELPVFLIPYEIKMEFSKDIKNKYVVFRFDNWDSKHPIGLLVDVLGDVNELSSFYEYQLYCRDLHCINVKVPKEFVQYKKINGIDYIDNIKKYTNHKLEEIKDVYIFSIDPIGSKDLDDAISIQLRENGGFKINIYIANVYIWLETFNLWQIINDRVSTIYLPDKRRTMLPSILSENLCSLIEKQERVALCMEINIDEFGNVEENNIKYKNVIINVAKNFVYEEPSLLKNKNYKLLYDVTKQINPNIMDSHDLIEHWMIYMNSMCGKMISRKRMGIFRIAEYKKGKHISNVDVDIDTKQILQNWNNISSKYALYSKNIVLHHESLNIENYIHITSPIRRMVDLLNQILFCNNCLENSFAISIPTQSFLNAWLINFKKINECMKSIRKVENDCELITKITNHPEIMDEIHEGIVIETRKKESGIYENIVYLKKYKIIGKIKSENEMGKEEEIKVKIYMLEDEYKMNRKIRMSCE